MNKKIKNTILSIILLLTLVPEFFNTFKIFGVNYAYVIKPVLFCFICIIVFVFFKNEKIVNTKHKKDVISYVIIAALIYFFIYFGIGYVQGFAYSPYDNSIKGILLNLWVLLPVLISKEYSRYVLINNGDKKHVYLRALLISILFFILNINVSKLGYYFS